MIEFFRILKLLNLRGRYLMVMTLSVAANFIDLAFIVSTYSVFENIANNEIASNDRLNILEQTLFQFIPFTLTD